MTTRTFLRRRCTGVVALACLLAHRRLQFRQTANMPAR